MSATAPTAVIPGSTCPSWCGVLHEVDARFDAWEHDARLAQSRDGEDYVALYGLAGEVPTVLLGLGGADGPLRLAPDVAADRLAALSDVLARAAANLRRLEGSD